MFDADSLCFDAHATWVKTATKMHYQEAEERTKELMLQEKPRKDCTPAEIDAMQKRLASNHDTVAGTSAQRPEEIAAHMAANGHGGIGGAFQGPVADLGDVTQLAPGEEEGQDDEEEEDEEEEDDVDPAEDTGLVHKKVLRPKAARSGSIGTRLCKPSFGEMDKESRSFGGW